MVKYSCEKCGREFKQKSHHDQHLKRKTPCVNSSKLEAMINTVVDNRIKQLDQHTETKHTGKRPDIIYNALDLFCGCGGMSQGLIDAGINVIAGIDIWDKAIESYGQNFDHDAICADLTAYPPKQFEREHNKKHLPIDIIVGGPPCPGFSIAGKRDKKDPRNLLFMEFYKYINYFEPMAFIMENVIGILSMKTDQDEKVIDIIMEKLGQNYNCIICKLYASDFGVPQNRRRTIIIGVRKDLDIIPSEPSPVLAVADRIPVKTVLLPKKLVDKSHFLSERAISGILAKKERMKGKGYGFGAQYLDMNKPSYTIPARYWKDGYDALVKYSDHEMRRLTVTELMKIQSFPDDFVIVGNKREMIMQIGNAVASRFAYHIGKHLINILS